MSPEHVAGIWPMLYAFFDSQGRLDRAAMRRQVEIAAASDAAGVAILGLATEVAKLSTAERRTVLDWTAEDLRGRKPLAVTIAESSVAGQVEFARAAHQAGAGFVILQPPPVKGLPEAEYLDFFAAVAAGAPLPVAIQNAPDYIGIGLSREGLIALNRRQPNVALLKAEAPALAVRSLIEQAAGGFRVLNGRGGLELPDNRRAGCVGMIPGGECYDLQARIWRLLEQGQEREAEALYASILPLILFLMQSMDQFLCYGKRLAARRLGLGPVQDRAPAMRPSEFGLAMLERLGGALPVFP
ncbi:MAG: dihydrodipicolinate synthase family protein [Alphaproteobacteria bacterium]|nr:dihydrodipicolinate synthase family protein [Alphaproteobacteria bacterium]